MSRAFHSDRVRWNSLARLVSKSLFFAALPIAMVVFVHAGEILDFVYGVDAFPGSVTVLRFFAVTIFIRFSVEIYEIYS